MNPVGVAVVGAGYWGPNLVRNFQANVDTRLQWVCDIDEEHRAVQIVAIGEKEGNRLLVGGEEMDL